MSVSSPIISFAKGDRKSEVVLEIEDWYPVSKSGSITVKIVFEVIGIPIWIVLKYYYAVHEGGVIKDMGEVEVSGEGIRREVAIIDDDSEKIVKLLDVIFNLAKRFFSDYVRVEIEGDSIFTEW